MAENDDFEANFEKKVNAVIKDLEDELEKCEANEAHFEEVFTEITDTEEAMKARTATEKKDVEALKEMEEIEFDVDPTWHTRDKYLRDKYTLFEKQIDEMLEESAKILYDAYENCVAATAALKHFNINETDE